MSGRKAKEGRRVHGVILEPKPEPKPLVAQRYATYRGNHGASLGTIVGPNTLGEHLVSIDCDYDSVTNRSRIGFAYLPRRTR